MEMIQEDLLTDPVKFLNRLSSVIPLVKIQEAVKDDIEDALKEAKDMYEEAKFYLQMTNETVPMTIQRSFSSVLDGIISVIETASKTIDIM